MHKNWALMKCNPMCCRLVSVVGCYWPVYLVLLLTWSKTIVSCIQHEATQLNWETRWNRHVHSVSLQNIQHEATQLNWETRWNRHVHSVSLQNIQHEATQLNWETQWNRHVHSVSLQNIQHEATQLNWETRWNRHVHSVSLQNNEMPQQCLTERRGCGMSVKRFVHNIIFFVSIFLHTLLTHLVIAPSRWQWHVLGMPCCCQSGPFHRCCCSAVNWRRHYFVRPTPEDCATAVTNNNFVQCPCNSSATVSL